MDQFLIIATAVVICILVIDFIVDVCCLFADITVLVIKTMFIIAKAIEERANDEKGEDK